MSTALRKTYGNHTCIQMILTNNVSPRGSQDDKILPEHIKINPKLNPFSKNLIQKKRNVKKIL